MHVWGVQSLPRQFYTSPWARIMSLFLNGSHELEVAITYYTPAVRSGCWYGEESYVLQLKTMKTVPICLLYAVWRGIEGNITLWKSRQINEMLEITVSLWYLLLEPSSILLSENCWTSLSSQVCMKHLPTMLCHRRRFIPPNLMHVVSFFIYRLG